MARTGIRSSAIIIKSDKILLIHRKKQGKEYWVFPGGGVEEGETAEETVRREVEEEISLTCREVKFAFKEEILEGGTKHPFFYCKISEGEPKLGGPEFKKHSEQDWYHPEWVKLQEISGLLLYPEKVKARLLKKYS